MSEGSGAVSMDVRSSWAGCFVNSQVETSTSFSPRLLSLSLLSLLRLLLHLPPLSPSPSPSLPPSYRGHAFFQHDSSIPSTTTPTPPPPPSPTPFPPSANITWSSGGKFDGLNLERVQWSTSGSRTNKTTTVRTLLVALFLSSVSDVLSLAHWRI